MTRYIDADILSDALRHLTLGETDAARATMKITHYVSRMQTVDVVEADKAQREIDYWHDKAQSYEQTILKLSLNKADVVEVVRCKDCKRWFTGSGIDHDKYGAECVVMKRRMMPTNFCSYGERADT